MFMIDMQGTFFVPLDRSRRPAALHDGNGRRRARAGPGTSR